MNYKTLPKGYRFAGTMEFTRNRKQILAMFKLSIALVVIPAAIGLAICPPWVPLRELGRHWPMWLITAAMLIAYIPLHELTHGIVMHALSGVRPTYGFKLPYAYAGSTVWFDRRSHILTALAPVVLWGIILQVLICTLPGRWFWPLWLTQISNLSGSAGDIYCVWYLMRMEGDLLIQDTGVRMRIYRKTAPPAEEKNP